MLRMGSEKGRANVAYPRGRNPLRRNHCADVVRSQDIRYIYIRIVYNGKAYLPTYPTNAHLRPLQSVHPVHILSIRSRTYGPTQRGLHVRAHQSVSRISALSVRFTEARDPTFGETDADVDLVGLEGRDHVAGAGGEGDEGTL